MATANTTSNTSSTTSLFKPSPIPELAAARNELVKQYNDLNNAPDVETRRAMVQAAYQENKADNEAAKAFTLGTPESVAAEKKASDSFKNVLAAAEAARPDLQALNGLKGQVSTYDAHIEAYNTFPTANQPTAKTEVAAAKVEAEAVGAMEAKTTNGIPGSPTANPPTALPVTPPVTQTNIDNTSNLAQSPEQQGTPAATPTTTTPSEGNTTVIDRADDPGAYNNADRLQTEANDATAEAAQNSVTDNNDVKKRNNTVVSSAEDPGAYDAADRQQTAINDGVPDKSFAQSVQDSEDAYPRATGSDLNGVSFPDNGEANRPTAESPGVALASGAKDWRFRIQLAPSANYFYKGGDAGILAPLAATNGVIFPYTPQISLSYAASYTAQDLVHTNYKMHTYKNSSVESMTIAGDFTAQDTQEANYLLAVIHFFKSVTKMFYGQDQNPQRGIPPPLCYLTGFGQYQFDMHPVVITNFTYALPVDVDYVNAYPTNNTTTNGGQNNQPSERKGASTPNSANDSTSKSRLRISGQNGSGGLAPGGLPPPPVFSNNTNINQITRVPSKITIQLTCQPIVTRNAISNKFSLAAYSTGRLLQGSVNPGTGGGIW